MLKECKHHGMTEHTIRSRGTGTRCKKCAVVAVQKRRAKVKQMSVDLFNRSCSDCGLESEHDCVYDFHHLDPSQKDFAIAARGHCRSWESVQAELKKCVMLCANCHRIRHAL